MEMGLAFNQGFHDLVLDRASMRRLTSRFRLPFDLGPHLAHVAVGDAHRSGEFAVDFGQLGAWTCFTVISNCTVWPARSLAK